MTVALDTWIRTDKGVYQVKDLMNKRFIAWVNGETYASTDKGFTSGGKKRMFVLKTVNGHELKMDKEHKIYTPSGKVEAGSLRPGSLIKLPNDADWYVDETGEEPCMCTFKSDNWQTVQVKSFFPVGPEQVQMFNAVIPGCGMYEANGLLIAN